MEFSLYSASRTRRTAVRDTCGGKHPQLQFPTTKTGFPLFPVMIDIMQLELSIGQSALAFYRVADPEYDRQAEQ